MPCGGDGHPHDDSGGEYREGREAGLAGFEPATHGPGNRCSIP